MMWEFSSWENPFDGSSWCRAKGLSGVAGLSRATGFLTATGSLTATGLSENSLGACGLP